jgi:hypothetical protein
MTDNTMVRRYQRIQTFLRSTKEIKWKEWMSVNDKILIIQQINPSIAPHHAWEFARRFQIDELSPNMLSTIELSHPKSKSTTLLKRRPYILK